MADKLTSPYNLTFSWGEVRAQYIAAMRDNAPRADIGARMNELRDSLKSPRSRKFYGPDGLGYEDVLGWLDKGYDTRGLGGGSATRLTDDVERPHWKHSDDPDGELNYDLYMMGETDCYLNRTRRKSRSGVRVEIGYGFLATVKPQTVGEYGVFVGRILRTLEAQGLDVAVTAVNRAREVYHPGNGVDETRITLSRFGERIISREWSALWSPCGFRHLVFTAKTLGEAKHGLRVDDGFGSSRHAGWGVTFDARTRTLKVECDSKAGRFDEKKMRDDFAQVRQTI